jgi:protein-tyrosine phosphatase
MTARTDLPEPLTPDRYHLEVVCLGNICRSPTAHVVLEQRLADAGLADRVRVTSSGTANWHTGKPMDHRSAAALSGAGYDPTRHRASHYSGPGSIDLVLVMDESNLADVGGRTERVAMFRDFDPVEPGSAVPDPYYGGDDGFQEVLAMVERTSDAIVSSLQRHLRAEGTS